MRERRNISDRSVAVLLTALGSVVPKKPGSVVVHSSPDFEDGALSVIDGLIKRGHNPVVLLERLLDEASEARRPIGVQAILKNSWRGRIAYLRARTVITTHGPYRAHRPPVGQCVIHIWHGEAISKPSGRGDGQSAVPCTWTTVLSRVGAAFRTSECGLHPRQALVVGAARNDRLLTADRSIARSRLVPGDPDSFVVAWLPTYRQQLSGLRPGRIDGAAHAGILPMPEAELSQVDRWLTGKRITLLAKPHPTALRQAAYYDHIEVVDDAWLARRQLTTYEMLAAVDALITDASSVWVDFLLLDRPIIFAFPDLREYEQSRGINLEPFEMWAPGPVVSDAAGLITAVTDLLEARDRFANERLLARKRFHKFADAHSTDRLLDAVKL